MTREGGPVVCVWQVLDRENAPVMKLPLTPQALDKLVPDAGLGGADAGGQIRVEFLAVRGRLCCRHQQCRGSATPSASSGGKLDVAAKSWPGAWTTGSLILIGRVQQVILLSIWDRLINYAWVVD